MTVVTFRPASRKKPCSWATANGRVSALVGKFPTVTVVSAALASAWVALGVEEPHPSRLVPSAIRLTATKADRLAMFIFFFL
ncbi:hypothetical protein [Parafrankia sp. EUN1f]|uniref:hypothetical protein n=1 Tax=Parafrankia sp. EUN1f TaxID=102897 RepID=UPI00055AB648|nr:hypothetical protein [Parafrankia sp. EUN1f]